VLRLIVMRHAHSPNVPTGDHARPLSAIGEQGAHEVGAALSARGWAPDLVLSSDAVRTRSTWAGMQGQISGQRPVEWHRSFYTGGADAVLEQLYEGTYTADKILVLGHNPEWERLVRVLSGQPVVMTPATAALLLTDMPSWSSAVSSPGKFRLFDVVRPEET
jgi:phosphohistidine phosphatase